MLGQSIGKNSLILGLFAAVTAAVLATTYLATAERIAEAEIRAAKRALLEIFPASSHDNDLLTDVLPLTTAEYDALNLDDAASAHLAKRDGEVIGVILPSVASDGYGGDIKLLVGVKRDGTVAGVRVLSHSETPGLGDKIELKKSDWILGFRGKSLNAPPPEDWAVKKDGGVFDQFTGATITPRAVVNQVQQTLQTVQADRERLFQLPQEKP